MSKIPAGKYYVGDACYVIDDAKWMDFLETGFWPAEKKGEVVFEYEGHKCFAHHTAYGDGVFTDTKTGARLPVDAGMLSAIPLALVAKRSLEDVAKLGIIVEFEKETEVSYNDGTFYIGGHTIHTGDDGEVDEDWDDEDDEQDDEQDDD